MKRYLTSIIFASLAVFASCSKAELQPEQATGPASEFESIPAGEITISLDPQETKTSFSYGNKILSEVWRIGDIVALSPYASYGGNYTLMYTATTGGSRTTVFRPSGNSYYSVEFSGLYYPGEEIQTDMQFCNFSYKGQLQTKSDPLGHLPSYRALRKLLEYSGQQIMNNNKLLTFADADQSSCMHLILSGVEFDHPVKVTMLASSPVFFNGNVIDGGPYDNGSETLSSSRGYTNSISIELGGYGMENSLDVFIMISNNEIVLNNTDVTVEVELENGFKYVNTQTLTAKLQSGHCHNYTADKNWTLVDWSGMAAFHAIHNPGIYDLSDPENPLPLYTLQDNELLSYSTRSTGWMANFVRLEEGYVLCLASNNASLSTNSLHMMNITTMGDLWTPSESFVNAKVIDRDSDSGLVWMTSSDDKTGIILMTD